jgi:hypothetical protein
MADDAVRPVFKDRILDEHEGAELPQFDINSPFLPLLNTVKQAGTFMTAGQMNNMLYPANLAAFGKSRCVADFSNKRHPRLKIVVDDVDADGVTVVKRTVMEAEMVENPRNNWTYADKLYDKVLRDDGTIQNTLVQERRGNIVRNGRVLSVTML